MNKVTLQAKKFIGISVKTSNQGNAAEDIGALWHRFMSENLIAKIPNRVSDKVYSIYTEYEGDYLQPYTCVLGCEVSSSNEIPDGMKAIEAPAQTYATLTDKGDLSQGLVYNCWVKAWKDDLDRRYECDFEIYDEKSQDPKNAEVTIYIGIK
jgi:predicted transcriptional regulator YdeE